MKKHTVSIITTYYNAANFILDAVNSVTKQVFDASKIKVEYVLVNDKSPDNSKEILESYIDNFGNSDIEYKLVEPEENLGCGGARKFGIDNSSGDYLMFLDADDYYINNDFVQRAYDDITKNKVDIVEYGVVMNTPDGRQSNMTTDKSILITNPETAVTYLYKYNLIKFNVWSKIYTRAITQSFQYSTTRTFEDVRTIPIWVYNAKKILIQPSLEINYRAVSNSIIRDDQIKTRYGTILAIAEQFEMFKQYPELLKDMYGRAMIDLSAILENHSSKDPGFIEMSKLNTHMLSYIYPSKYKDMTYDVETENTIEEK